MASSLGLRAGSQKGSRNTTPPNSNIPPDTNITPPGQIIDTAGLASPPDPLTVTPAPFIVEAQSTPQKSKPTSSAFGSMRFRQKPTPAVLEPDIFGQGTTGVDSSLPIFDGTSTNPEDYLIDLDSDSMETAPDVRSYFHYVGDMSQDPTTPPVDLEERKVYDDKLVKQGREYLKAARARGHGLYLLADRDLLAYNIPGGPWYRMPLTGIVDAFLRREQQPTKDEGGFMLDPDWIAGVEATKINQPGQCLIGESYPSHIQDEAQCNQTNIRSAIWWGDTMRLGVVPGARGWDRAIFSIYSADGHPSAVMWGGMGGRATIVDDMRMMDGKLFQAAKATEINQPRLVS